MKQYKIILLDVDGTLLDFDKAEEQGIFCSEPTVFRKRRRIKKHIIN